MEDEILLHKKTAAFDLYLTQEQDQEECLAWLAIDLPDTEVNLLSAAMVDEINELIDLIETKDNISGLIIYSAKAEHFILGADIKMLQECRSEKEAEKIALKGQQVFARIEKLPFHVVAAIQGLCLGGGLELALACHSRVVSANEKTRLGLPEVKLGLLPGSGGTQRLTKLVGTLTSLELTLFGRAISAKEALKIGLVDDLVARSILLDIAKKRALKPKPKRKNGFKNWLISYNPIFRGLIFKAARKKIQAKTRGNYPATDAILEVIECGLAKGEQAGFSLEAARFGQLVMTKASHALRHLFFISNEIKKERGSKAKPKEINQLTILGAGLMGSGIAYVSAMSAKVLVSVKDLSNDNLLRALEYSYRLLNKERQRKKLSTAELQKKMTALSVSTEYQAYATCDMVIEAVFEDLALKRQLLAEVEQHFSSNCIFATNTSSIPIHQIAAEAARPENIIGIHYFSPVEKMPLVEIIPHSRTSKATVASAVKFAKQQAKIPIVVADKAGFYVNRILAAYLNEAARLLLEGEQIGEIDNALLNFGFPTGPFSLLDDVGIDICAKVSPILAAELGERFASPPLFDIMLTHQRLGRKTHKGFYSYKNQKKKEDKQLYSLLEIKANPKLSAQEMALRCFLAMLNECARAFEDGIIRSARDGDIGAIFGLGFPPFLGGPFCYMDNFTSSRTVNLMRKFQQRYGERFAPCDLLVKMKDEKSQFYSTE